MWESVEKNVYTYKDLDFSYFFALSARNRVDNRKYWQHDTQNDTSCIFMSAKMLE